MFLTPEKLSKKGRLLFNVGQDVQYYLCLQYVMDNSMICIYRNSYPKCGCSDSLAVSSEKIVSPKLNTTQNSGLLASRTLSIVWYSKEHSVLETDLFPSLGEGVGDTFSVH
jgi:hypothetical protein